MPVELYETLYMLDANKMATDGDLIRESLHSSLSKYNAEILVSRPWDESRKIAYPIRKQNITHKKAYYYIIYYRMESKNQLELDGDMRLGMTDYLLRYMTSKIDPKYADMMLDVANREQAAGFALRGMQEEATPTEINPGYTGDGSMMMESEGGYGGDRPERGRRRRDGDDKPE
jgi:ribosomal protein S6